MTNENPREGVFSVGLMAIMFPVYQKTLLSQLAHIPKLFLIF